MHVKKTKTRNRNIEQKPTWFNEFEPEYAAWAKQATKRQDITAQITLEGDVVLDEGWRVYYYEQDPQDWGPLTQAIGTRLWEMVEPNGYVVGYLKVSYTNQLLCDYSLKNIWGWLDKATGQVYYSYIEPKGLLAEIDRDQLWRRAHWNNQTTPASWGMDGGGGWPALNKVVAKTTPVPEEKIREADLQVIADSWYPKCEEWLEFQSVPYVAFARVYDAYDGGGIDWRRQGIATKLYTIAGRMEGNQNRILRGSSLQSESVQKLWEHLKTTNTHVKTREIVNQHDEPQTQIYLDYRIAPNVPNEKISIK